MIDLARVKLHLKVDGEEEDTLIAGYVEAAKSHVAMHCDRELVEGNPAGPEQMGFTPDVEQAVLLMVGHWYANREAVVIGTITSEVPLAVERLLWYRKRF
ncbi:MULTISPECIES: head-tail connector protein [Pseudomonas syringae group]|uniref:Pyruvate:ferredoxin oxidoreductase or related 2-oxoacid:ferredoxin oxidoreductase n=2 Tax=Pseudomonas syringae TaxID=317 RepID=A0A2V0QKU5_PSESF|nr:MULTISPECIES: head-tail connector protein [Pseudomonas syringae group]EPM91091.1 phage protein [Pseudomonas syringae pv. actinidiae ICMP 19070]EPM82446.1 phage protein [Pseudomonas syringae pv. actinidiae ICMP 19068]MBS7440267.1 head-tail connector protein [Pseudomonas syringae]MBS7463835.1 head-tail connector protein [Pseudomonas syringae]MCH5515497.1 head-tail connector protein [Pseudomonas syringae pv. syringae]